MVLFQLDYEAGHDYKELREKIARQVSKNDVSSETMDIKKYSGPKQKQHVVLDALKIKVVFKIRFFTFS